MAVASRGHRPLAGGEVGPREPGTAFWDYLFSLSLAVGVAALGIAVWAMVTGRGADLQAQRKQARLAGLVFVAALILLAGTSSRFADVSRLDRREVGDAGQPPGRPSPVDGRELEPYRPEFQWAPVLLLAGAVLATAVVVLSTRRRVQLRPFVPRTGAELVDALAALLDAALDDLYAEPDPRRAVIAAYARMERTLAAYGLPRAAFEAPLEYLDRIASPLHERLPPARRLVFELTYLFEWAKFSSHEIDAATKRDAIARLEALRDELRRAEAA